jgi:hypothetical protein
MKANAETLPPGIYTMPESQYHADPCLRPSLSNSIIKVLTTKSPRHAWFAHPRLNPQHQRNESAEFDVGRAGHAWLLEGRDICVVVDANDWRTKAAQAARDDAAQVGKVALLTRQYESLSAMVATARNYLDSTGLAEASPSRR